MATTNRAKRPLFTLGWQTWAVLVVMLALVIAAGMFAMLE